MSTTTITWSWGDHKTISFNPATDILDFGWISADYFSVTESNGSVTILIPSTQQSVTLQGVSLSQLSLANISAKDASVYAEWSTVLAGAATATGGVTTTLSAHAGTDTVLDFNPAKDKLDFGTLTAADFSMAEADGSVVIYLPATQQTYILEGVSLSELTRANIVSANAGVLAEWSGTIAGGAAAAKGPVVADTAGVDTTTITWAWNQQVTVTGFDPAKDKLDFGWISSDYFSVAEVNGSVVILIPRTQQSYTLDGVSLSELSAANIVAKDSSVFTEWAAAIANATTVTAIALHPGTDTVLDFDPAHDKLDFGTLTAGDFSLAETNGSVVIYIPSAKQTYVLEGVTLEELKASSIISSDAGVQAEWKAAIAAGTAGAITTAPSAANAAGGVTTSVTWSWNAQSTIANFDPAKDKLDFGWFSADYFSITEVNGSVMILIPSTQQSITLTGVTLDELSLSNIVAKDPSVFKEWSAALAGAHAGTVTDITPDHFATTVLDFDPAHDTLDFGSLSAADFAISQADGSVVVYLPATQQTYILAGVTLSELSMANITSADAAVLGEWNSAISAAGKGGAATPVAVDGVAKLDWAFGTQTVLDFDPATDKLDFGRLSPDDFTITEVNGSVVILIPSNQQSYTLEGVTLAELTSASIVSQNDWVLAKWTAALGEDAAAPGTAVNVTEPMDAPAWSAGSVYTTGDLVTVGNVVYEANWWTKGIDPESDHGGVGTGHVWTVVGYVDLTPVAPDAPADVAALTTTDTSVVLSWDPAFVQGVGTVTEYAIYQDGVLIGTTSDCTLKVSGLAAGTSYDFSVVALDEAGASPHSSSLAVTTDAAGTAQAEGQYFSPYMEMWLPSSGDLVQMVQDADLKAVTLAFIIGTGDGEIGWGSVGTSLADDTLSNGKTISSIVDELHAMGVAVSISFGGAYGQEPALYFDNATDLAAAYQSVMDKYDVTSLDFDIEAGALTDDAASHLRNEALVELEKANPDLSISFTLPVTPSGLTQDGLDFLAQAAADGVEIDTVNIMVMNYGEYQATGDMGNDAISAAEATIHQLEALGIDAKVAITPEAGYNDLKGEVFTLEDAQQLVDYAEGNEHISYLAMWSLGRDNGDTEGYYSIYGSGLSQHDYDFSKIFSHV